jgi:hypothetical protein
MTAMTAFTVLVNKLKKLNIKVIVADRRYMAWVIKMPDRPRAFVFIAKEQNWEQRLVALAHEAGHLFHVDKETLKMKWRPSSSEWAANRRAAIILEAFNKRFVKILKEYYQDVYMRLRRKK